MKTLVGTICQHSDTCSHHMNLEFLDPYQKTLGAILAQLGRRIAEPTPINPLHYRAREIILDPCTLFHPSRAVACQPACIEMHHSSVSSSVY